MHLFIISLTKLFDELYYPLAVAAIIGLFLLKEKKEKTIIVIFLLFSFVWRLFFRATVGRYYCFFILLCIYLLCCLFQKMKGFSIVILLACIVVQLIKSYSGFRNVYVSDIQDEIKRANSQNSSSFYLIDEKEYYRLSITPQNNTLLIPRSNHIKKEYFLDYFLRVFAGWYNDLYLISRSNIRNDYNGNLPEALTTLMSFKTGRNSKRIQIYSITNTPVQNDISHVLDNNLIANGSFEATISQPHVKNYMKPWIDDGASWYSDENIKLPKFSFLIPVWMKRNNEDYPHVAIEESSPINGKYSLRISFSKNEYNEIYLLNKVPSQKGILHFSVKSSYQNYPLIIQKGDYNKDNQWKYFENQTKFYIWPQKDIINSIELKWNDEDFYDSTVLYLISGKDTEIIIDDVSFFTQDDHL